MERTDEDTAQAAGTVVRTKDSIESWVMEATKVTVLMSYVELCPTESNDQQEVLPLKAFKNMCIPEFIYLLSERVQHGKKLCSE